MYTRTAPLHTQPSCARTHTHPLLLRHRRSPIDFFGADTHPGGARYLHLDLHALGLAGSADVSALQGALSRSASEPHAACGTRTMLRGVLLGIMVLCFCCKRLFLLVGGGEWVVGGGLHRPPFTNCFLGSVITLVRGYVRFSFYLHYLSNIATSAHLGGHLIHLGVQVEHPSTS